MPYLDGYWEAPFNHGKSPTAPPASYAEGEPLKPSGCLLRPDPPKHMFSGRPLGDNGIAAGGVYLALHMSLIPRGPHQGKILVWGHEHYAGENPSNQARAMYWSVFDPETKVFQNFMWCYPDSEGDLFCAGHSFDEQGNLFVAGGTMDHGADVNSPGWTGSKITFVYKTDVGYSGQITPLNNPWQRGPDLDLPATDRPGRWYPSVAMLGPWLLSPFQSMLMVAGGTWAGFGQNSYQLWDRRLNNPGFAGGWHVDQTLMLRLFLGPQSGASSPWPFGFTDYPRLSLLSTADVVSTGMPPGSDRVKPYVAPHGWLGDTSWVQLLPPPGAQRAYGSSLLLPIRVTPPSYDYVVSLGGANDAIVHDSMYVSFASGTPTQRAWAALPSMGHRRMYLNTVLLPDGSFLALGGRKHMVDTAGQRQDAACTREAAYRPELYVNGEWREMEATHIIRDYHSTALLLPNGKVLHGGGESREWEQSPTCIRETSPPMGHDPFPRNAIAGPVDYQVFVPPNIEAGAQRPTITNAAPHGSAIGMSPGGTYEITYSGLPFDASITKAVILWPGSVTHHSDGNQRCVELEMDYGFAPFPPDGTGSVTVKIPINQYLVPKGYYMLYLLTSQGALCEKAAWVQVQ